MTPLFWCKKLRQFVLDRKFIHFWKDRRLWEKWVLWYLLLHRFCHSIHLSSRQGQWPNGVKGVSWPVFTPSGPRERNDRAEARAVSLQVSKVWLVESEEKLLHEMWKCANLILRLLPALPGWPWLLIVDSTRIVVGFNWKEIISDWGNWTQQWIYRMGLKGNHGLQRNSTLIGQPQENSSYATGSSSADVISLWQALKKKLFAKPSQTKPLFCKSVFSVSM